MQPRHDNILLPATALHRCQHFPQSPFVIFLRSAGEQLLNELSDLLVSERTAYMTHAHQRPWGPCSFLAANGLDLIVRFNVKVNGVNRIDFVQKAALMRNHNEDAWWYYDPAIKAGIRTKLSTATPGTAAGTCRPDAGEA